MHDCAFMGRPASVRPPSLSQVMFFEPEPTVAEADESFERAARLEEVGELHRTMIVRLLRLEAMHDAMDDGPTRTGVAAYLSAACVLKDRLFRAAVVPASIPDVVPAFDGMFIDVLSLAYSWSIDHIDGVRKRVAEKPEKCRPGISPGELLSSMRDIVDLCAAAGSGQPQAKVLSKALRAIEGAIRQLASLGQGLEPATAASGR